MLTNHKPNTKNLTKIIFYSLASRLLILLLMLLSDVLIQTPFDYPDDKLTFSTSLQIDRTSSSSCIYNDVNEYCTSISSPSPPPPRNTWSEVLTHPFKTWDASHFLTLARDGRTFGPSIETLEKRHAFYPLFPTIIRIICWGVFDVECKDDWCFVFVGLIVNIVAFTLSAVMLYKLTYTMIANTDKLAPLERERERLDAAYTTTLIYILNPASVFFTTNYSESVFALCCFSSYYYLEKIAQSQYSHVFSKDSLMSLVWLMLCGFTRSNSILFVGVIVVYSIGLLFTSKVAHSHSTTTKLSIITLAILQIIAITTPPQIHEYTGYTSLCLNPTLTHSPQWCSSYINQTPAWTYTSIYGYVQSTYWNVGLFSYYTINNVPNFMLAVPMVGLAVKGGGVWIVKSFGRWVEKVEDGGSGWMVGMFVRWAVDAIRSQRDDDEIGAGEEVERKAAVKSSSSSSSSAAATSIHSLYYQNRMLTHYAILVITTLICLTYAHVQIVTRVTCSSCPALYWSIASEISRDDKTKVKEETKRKEKGEWKEKEEGVKGWWKSLNWFERYLGVYFVAFNVVGIVMNANFLPWT